MFAAEIDDYRVVCTAGLLDGYGTFRERATLLDEFALDDPAAGTQCTLAVGHAGEEWPFLVVGQRYKPYGPGFTPGALIVSQTHRLFVGAGQRLLAYVLIGPRRLWEDVADFGFWGWARHGDVVLMAAELELAAWDVQAQKLWTAAVEPPWGYQVSGNTVSLDVMGTKTDPLHGGPPSHHVGQRLP